MKPKKLTLREMWELHKILQNGIGTQQEYLIDEILEMMGKISQEDFLSALWLLYPKIEFAKHNPVEMVTLLIAGLKKNSFFEFTDLVRGLKHDNA